MPSPRAGDLGYVYGTYESAEAKEGGNFVRILRREGRGAWRIVLDLLNPRPAANAGGDVR